LKRHPECRLDFLILSAWGALLVLFMHEGPWIMHMVPYFWPIQIAALLSWAIRHHFRHRSLTFRQNSPVGEPAA
jgi:hypothetical protein